MQKQEFEVFIRIVRAGLCGEKVTIPENFNPEMFFAFAKKHRIMNIVYHGLAASNLDNSSPVMQKLYMGAVAELSFHERQAKEIEKIFCLFEENKISYMPLKGTVLKSLYKKPEMRSMGDADILIRLEEYDRIKEVMTKLGYEQKYESNHELVWKKGKTFIIELHKTVVPNYNEEFFKYFGDGWSKALKEGSAYRHSMSNENEFIYVFTHFAKHYRAGGIGVRQLSDLWLLLKNRQLDFNFIEQEMEKLSLLQFYKNVRRTIAFWFESGPKDEVVELISRNIIKNGAFGTFESSYNSFVVRLAAQKGPYKKKNKTAMWLFKCFPPAKFIKHKYRFLEEYPYMLPIAWAHRWIDAIFLHRGKIKKGLSAIKNINIEKSSQIEEELSKVGLSFNCTED